MASHSNIAPLGRLQSNFVGQSSKEEQVVYKVDSVCGERTTRIAVRGSNPGNSSQGSTQPGVLTRPHVMIVLL
jgi:hypothetical protein